MRHPYGSLCGTAIERVRIQTSVRIHLYAMQMPQYYRVLQNEHCAGCGTAAALDKIQHLNECGLKAHLYGCNIQYIAALFIYFVQVLSFVYRTAWRADIAQSTQPKTLVKSNARRRGGHHNYTSMTFSIPLADRAMRIPPGSECDDNCQRRPVGRHGAVSRRGGRPVLSASHRPLARSNRQLFAQ